MKSICGIAIWLFVASTGAGETRLGKPVTLEKATPVRELLEHPDSYLGKPVRVDGEITAVCQAMGCWIEVRDDSGASIRLKVEDGEIVFPKDGVGRKVMAQGTLEKLVLTPEQRAAALEHEAHETGKKVDKARSADGTTIYRLRGQGAVILPVGP